MLATVMHDLRAAKGEWPAVSRNSGVPYTTVAHIAQGRIADPRISTVQALYDYFEACRLPE
jgi:predicted transcriptional regulator